MVCRISSITFFISLFFLFAININCSGNKLQETVLDNQKKITENDLKTSRIVIQQKIVDYHNFFRSRVSPPASNMLKMSWNKEAATLSQRYAESCQYLTHSKSRPVEPYGECGENIYVSEVPFPWFAIIQSWFNERQNFTYGSNANNFLSIGHYTQVAWATTHQVGCGVAKCNNNGFVYHNYICTYCPTGNLKWNFPYKVGKPCESCRGRCSKEKLCTNPCPYVDEFTNCIELIQTQGNHICSTKSCKASCKCGDNYIHKQYPF